MDNEEKKAKTVKTTVAPKAEKTEKTEKTVKAPKKAAAEAAVVAADAAVGAAAAAATAAAAAATAAAAVVAADVKPKKTTKTAAPKAEKPVKAAEPKAKAEKPAAAKAPKAAAPKAEAPKAPKAEKPAAPEAPEAPKAEVPKAPAAPAPKAPEVPKVPEAPKAEAPKAASAPKAETPKAPAPKTDAAPKAKKEAANFGKRTNQNRLRDYYKKTVIPQLMKEFAYKNINEVPRLEKIILNMRLGDIKDNSKSVNSAMEELRTISGQKSVFTKARHSLANWKIREGMVIGAKVTLRGDRMYDFYDKLISIALPRVRDFRGVSPKAFDGRGNYATGIKEQLIFPEISYDQVEKVRGFDICIITSAKTDEHAKALLKAMGMPFKNN